MQKIEDTEGLVSGYRFMTGLQQQYNMQISELCDSLKLEEYTFWQKQLPQLLILCSL